MALWLVRGGRHGQYEQKFLDENRIFLTWDDLDHDLSKVGSQESLRDVLETIYPSASKHRILVHAAEIWTFSHRMAVKDWIVLPCRNKPAIHVAEIKGGYEYHASAENPFYHSRAVEWLGRDIARTNFDTDLLYSFGSLLTICQIKRKPDIRQCGE